MLSRMPHPVQVLSPASIMAVDLSALMLLDLPCLVAFILGLLADEFGWLAKSFPQPFSVSCAGGVGMGGLEQLLKHWTPLCKHRA
jgi:hypothetical protein